MENISQIKDIILNYFSETIGEDSKTYQTISERMQNLQIQVLKNEDFITYYEERMGKGGMIPSGFYDARYQKVILKNVNLQIFRILETVIHEIIHALSHNGTNKLGLIQYDKGLGRGFNEMATCYITSKILGKGYGGSYSQDFRNVFKMFLTTMRMDDRELFNIFFQSEDWIIQDMAERFNKYDTTALNHLISLYDNRTTNKFDKNLVLEIIGKSAITNNVQNNDEYRDALCKYCNYFEIPNLREDSFMTILQSQVSPNITSDEKKAQDPSAKNKREIEEI